MVYICRRGRENLRDLKKGHFTVGKDLNGHKFVAQAVDELTQKKTREDNPASRKDAGRMYATGKEDCPVKSIKKYLEKLTPKCESLFQTAKCHASESGPWDKSTPCGVKGQILKMTLPQENGRRIKTPSSILTILVSSCWKRILYAIMHTAFSFCPSFS